MDELRNEVLDFLRYLIESHHNGDYSFMYEYGELLLLYITNDEQVLRMYNIMVVISERNSFLLFYLTDTLNRDNYGWYNLYKRKELAKDRRIKLDRIKKVEIINSTFPKNQLKNK